MCICIPKFVERNAPALAGLRSRFWSANQVLTVRCLNATSEQEEYTFASASEWMKHCGITFDFVSSGNADIRVVYDSSDGAWSYLGRDNQSIPFSRPTMNLGWIGGGVGEHEFGHALGMITSTKTLYMA